MGRQELYFAQVVMVRSSIESLAPGIDNITALQNRERCISAHPNLFNIGDINHENFYKSDLS